MKASTFSSAPPPAPLRVETNKRGGGAIDVVAHLRISPTSGFDPNGSSIFIVMVGGIGGWRAIIAARLSVSATRLFGQYGSADLVVLGLRTLVVAIRASHPGAYQRKR